MWFVFALLSAVFAALTSILAKVGIDGVNSNLATAIRTVVVLVTAWQVIKATRRSVSARRSARQAERDEQARRQELEEARSRAYAAGQEDAKAASRVAENVSAAAEDRENP